MKALILIWWATIAAYCTEPDHAARWNAAKLRPEWTIQADKWIALWTRTHEVYERLEKARTNGVPAQFIFGFHVRESDASMRAHLHEGSPLIHRTRYVPKNRPPVWNPPNDWFSSALDALYDYERLERRDWQHLQPAMQAAESYNGLGYQKRGVVSPYLWSGTDVYSRGKYVADGRFDPMARDQQIGVAAILIRMRQRGMEIPSALQPHKNAIVLPKQSEPEIPKPIDPAPAPVKESPKTWSDLGRAIRDWFRDNKTY